MRRRPAAVATVAKHPEEARTGSQELSVLQLCQQAARDARRKRGRSALITDEHQLVSAQALYQGHLADPPPPFFCIISKGDHEWGFMFPVDLENVDLKRGGPKVDEALKSLYRNVISQWKRLR